MSLPPMEMSNLGASEKKGDGPRQFMALKKESLDIYYMSGITCPLIYG